MLAVQTIVETVAASIGPGSLLLAQFLSQLMLSQSQWNKIRQDLPLQVRKSHFEILCLFKDLFSEADELYFYTVVQMKASLVSMCSLVDEIPVVVQPLQRSLCPVLCGHLEIAIVPKATCSPLCLGHVGDGGPAFCVLCPSTTCS